MKIIYLENKAIDKDKWNDCIANSFNGLVYAYSWYLDAVCLNWHALIQGNYERVMPIAVKKKFGVHLIYQPFFIPQLGVFSKQKLNENIVSEFIKQIPNKYRYIEFCVNSHNKLKSNIGRQLKNNKLELDLIKSYDNIRKSYSETLKHNLKKASNNKLSLEKNNKPDDIIKLFRANNGKKLGYIKQDDYLKFIRLVYSGLYKGMTDVYGVYDSQNELCAGAIFMRSNHRVSSIISGINEIGEQLNAMPFLINNYIKDFSYRHLTFDFEDSNDNDTIQFHKSFGAQKSYYSTIVINHLKTLEKPSFYIYRKLRKLI